MPSHILRVAPAKKPAAFHKSPVVADKVCHMDYLIGATRGNKKIINSIVTRKSSNYCLFEKQNANNNNNDNDSNDYRYYSAH